MRNYGLGHYGRDFDPDMHARDAQFSAGSADSFERTGGDDGRPIPAFLRKGPASPPRKASPFETIEQGIYDLLHHDKGYRPSPVAHVRPAPERSYRGSIFRRALERIARGLGDHDEGLVGSGGTRRKGDADPLSTARFPTRAAQRYEQAGFRQPGNIVNIEEGRQFMADQYSGALDRRIPDPVPVADPIIDPEVESFVARVRHHVSENERLRAGLDARDETIKQQADRIAELEAKLRTIAAHIDEVTCAPPMPATSA